jgi:hypothetical protein
MLLSARRGYGTMEEMRTWGRVFFYHLTRVYYRHRFGSRGGFLTGA